MLDQGYAEDVTLSNLKLGFGVFAVALTVLAQFYPLPFPASAGFLKVCVLVYFAIQGLLQLLHLLVEKDCILLTKQRREGGESSSSSSGNSEKDKTNAERKLAAAQQQAALLGKKKKGGGVAVPSPSSAAASSDSASAAAAILPPFAVSLQATLGKHSSDYQLTLATRSSESVFASLRGGSGNTSSSSGASTDGAPAVAVSVALSITDYFDTEGVFLLERYHASLAELMAAYAEEVARVQAEGASGSEQAKKSQ